MGILNNILGNKDIKWKFIENGYGNESSLDSTDTETFKEDPIGSIARELCQNSIDARNSAEPVIVNFKSFYLETKKLPGIEELKKEMTMCRDSYKTPSHKYYKKFDEMISHLEREKIFCLRISDFNTKGLEGVKTNARDKAFYYLTKGNGLTTKDNSTSGGSKGIGKFASFVASNIQTVFYSTLNEDKEEGYIGITRLASRVIDEESGLCTTGYGYYSRSEKVLPILENFSLENNFKRNATGTDVYIIDFRAEENWKYAIASKVLDSFMVAINNGDLIVEIDDIIINKETLKDIVYNNRLLESEKKKIIGQYVLLNDATVFKTEVNIREHGNVKIFIKEFDKQEAHLATNKCVMIRYPYMKIKEETIPFIKPCSAMCIIEKNELNSMLRLIENPQHTNWEINRITDDSDLKKEVKKTILKIKAEIKNFAQECLLSGDDKELDIDGASDFLADGDFGNSEGKVSSEKTEKPTIISTKKANVTNNVGDKEDEDSLSNIVDIGEVTEDGDEVSITNGHNNGGGGHIHEGENNGGFNDEGEDEVLRRVHLTGIKAKPLLRDIEKGEYQVNFVSIYDEPNCEIEFYYSDDKGAMYEAIVYTCKIDGKDCDVENNKVKNVLLEKNKMYKFEFETNLDDIYACEVKVYANK